MAEKLIDTALTTVGRVKDELGLGSDSSSDSTISRYINEATDFIESYLGTQFGIVEGKEEVLAGSSDTYLLLKNKPILKINSITVNGSEITDYLENEDDFKVGMIYRENGWNKATYTTGGLTGDQFGERRTIVVNYDYGFVLPKDATATQPQTLPRDLEAVAIKLAVMKFKENQRDSYGLKELKQGRLTYKFSDEDLDKSTERVLGRYKSFGVW